MSIILYYPGFDVRRIGTDGCPINPGVQSLSVHNLTSGSFLGTITSDANGAVAGGSFTALPGDVVEFSHATYAGTMRITLAGTVEEAYLGKQASLILQNLFTKEVRSNRVQIYAQDLDNPDQPPIYLGEGIAGTTFKVPYQSNLPKRLRVFPRSFTDEGDAVKTPFDTDNFQDVNVPATCPLCLFDQFIDKATTGTTEETLHVYQIDAGQLSVNGDKIEGVYHFEILNAANEKFVKITLEGTTLYNEEITGDLDGPGRIEFWLQRVSASILAYGVQLADGSGAGSPIRGTVTSLDLDGTDYDLKFKALTTDAAGDITLTPPTSGKFWPAATTNTSWLLDENGEPLLDENNDELEG